LKFLVVRMAPNKALKPTVPPLAGLRRRQGDRRRDSHGI
jgi:hypothetical protein